LVFSWRARRKQLGMPLDRKPHPIFGEIEQARQHEKIDKDLSPSAYAGLAVVSK